MKPVQLMCQNCNTQHVKMKDFKAHVRNYKHKQEVAKLFQTAVHKGPVYFPMFVFLDYLRNPNQADPLIGFNVVTMFITPEKIGAFYLCHVCEQHLDSVDIVSHLSSDQHYFRYLAVTNPELLHFAWFNDSLSFLQSSAEKEYNTNGSGNLQVFELPKMMLRKCKKLQYHQVLSMFSKTDKLMERIQAGIPQRKSLQEYITDPTRTHPLLGLNLFLEYSCPKSEGYCGYLCILCKKKLSAAESISHCISFDHVYSYMNAAHPATLDSPRTSYSHYPNNKFHKNILYVANQAQTLCPPTEIQSIHLDLECFKVVNSSIYANALEKLQVIWKEGNKSELNVSITPGERIMFAPELSESSASTATTDGLKEQQEEKTQMEVPVSQTKDDPPCRILCVECDQTLDYLKNYKQHIKERQHKQKLIELFGPGQYSGPISQIKLYQYMCNRECKSSPPLIGLSLLTVFIQRHCLNFNLPFYLCHACELNIPVSSAAIHLTSTQHFFNVFSYSKPDLVFLGSQNLDQFAQEEHQSQEKQTMILQVCELPNKYFTELRILAYEKIMDIIGTQTPKLRKCVQVEKRVTLQSYSKSRERRSPLLGLQFMVKYSTTQHRFKCGYLCLLCEKKLPERHAIAHVLSFPHMFAYLNMAHPGSLNKEDSEKMSLIMDLGQQAEKITPDTSLREVNVSFGKFNEIEKNSFTFAVKLLQVIFQDKGLGELKPSLIPGARLVSSLDVNKENDSTKCEKQGHTSDSEKLNTDGAHTNTPMPTTEEKIHSESPDLSHTEHKQLLKSTDITSTHIQPAELSQTSSTTSSDITSSQPSIPSVPKEQSEALKLSQMTPEEPPDHMLTKDVPVVKPRQLPDSGVPKKLSAVLVQKPVAQVKALQKTAQCPSCLKTETPAVSQSHSSTCTKLECFLKMPNRPPVIGLKSVIECCTVGQQPFYICVTCAERCVESSLINHLLDRKHRLQYMKSIGYGPDSDKKKVMSKWVKSQAHKIEKSQGCGEAESLKLDAKDYHEISNANIITALGKLKDCLFKLTSAISAQSPLAACSSISKSFKSEEKDSQCADLKETLKSAEPDTEPETAKQSPDNPAQSSPDLWSYLTSPTRTEPVIGLSMITEYRNSNVQNSFLCACCEIILATSSYMGHLISPRHRFNYIKSKHPDLVALWKGEISLTSKISELHKKAQIVQDREGWGCLKVVQKDNKQKKMQQESEDTEIETSAKIQKREPSQTSDAGNSANALKLELSQTGGDTEPEDCNSHEPKRTKRQKKKINKRKAVIGLNFITCVQHDKKKLFFCELCSVRGHLDHVSSMTHRKTYVEHKYPGSTVSVINMEKKLHKIALGLAAVERSTGVGMKKLNVTAKVFTALRTAPLSEAMSQLKLLQMKPEDVVNLKTPQPEPSTFPDYKRTRNNSLDHVCSDATTDSFQLEKPHLLENNLVPELRSLSHHSSQISPPPPLLGSTMSSTLISPSFVHMPPPESPFQCLFVPNPLYEPVSPPSTPDCQDVTSLVPPYVYTAPAPPVYEPISPPQPSDSKDLTDVSSPYSTILPTPADLTHHMECKEPEDACRRSVMREESKFQHEAAPSQTYYFPNLPTVFGQSHASMFLNVMGLFNKNPIIGLSNILECRRISQRTFFLCLNCAEKVSRENFCDHMTSERHQHLSIRSQYYEIFQHWQWQTNHQMTVRELAEKVALVEKGLDAKVIKLNQTQYESLCSADFHDAIKILQRMFGPCLDESLQPSHLADQNQRNNDNSSVRKSPEPVVAEKESIHQSQQSFANATQIQEHHSTQVPVEETAQGSKNFTACTSTSNQLRQNQSSPKALSETESQTPQSQHQSVVQRLTAENLTPESDSRKSPLNSMPVTKGAKENPAIDCPNVTALETPESATVDLSGTKQDHTFPCTSTIKQEKTDRDGDLPSTLKAKSTKETTGKSLKPTDLKYINKNRTGADAVVGLSAVIECRSGGQASLYLCVSCSTKFNHDLINYHLVKSGHRYSYLKRRHPSLLEDWSGSYSGLESSMRLMRLAQKVEMTIEDEPGELQVMELACDDLKKIKTMSYEEAIKHLQKIRKEQNLCALKTCISPKITKHLIKQESMETDTRTQNSPQLPGTILQGPRRAVKRKAVEGLPHKSSSVKEQSSDVPSRHLEGTSAIESNQKPLDSVKRSKSSGNDTDSVSQLQKETSSLTTTKPNRSSYCTPATVPETSSSSCITLVQNMHKIDKTMHKSGKKQKSLSVIELQQKDSCPKTSTISAITSKKGQEITRLSEKRSSIKSHLLKANLSENAWNYENRQFGPETPSMTSTNPETDTSAETVAVRQQCTMYGVHNYNEVLSPHYTWKIPDKSLDPNLTDNILHHSVGSKYSTAASGTSHVTPEYAMFPPYLMYKPPDYTSVIAVSNTATPDTVPVQEKAMNYEATAPDISTNKSYLTNTNSTHTSHSVYQSQQVYQPIQVYQDPEPFQAYYACYYNQAVHTNQTAAGNENTATPAFEHGVYPLPSWPS